MVKNLNIGILGCPSVVWYSMIDPARRVSDVTVAGVASRSVEHAKAFAAEHAIPRCYDSYSDLLTDPDIDLVYIAVPTRAHFEWTMRALEHRKPVLCEKPLARNSDEAAAMAQAARAAEVSLVEGFHYRYHPVTRRVRELLRDGTIGRLRHIDTSFVVPAKITPPGHSRLRYEHAGGAALDPGCYCVSILRLLTGEEPSVVSAQARHFTSNVDVEMKATLEFPSGCTGTFLSTLDSDQSAVGMPLRIMGDAGEIIVPSAYGPHENPIIKVSANGTECVETLDSTMTFVFQLREVAAALREGVEPEFGGAEVAKNMAVIDRVYEAAGLPPRGK